MSIQDLLNKKNRNISEWRRSKALSLYQARNILRFKIQEFDGTVGDKADKFLANHKEGG